MVRKLVVLVLCAATAGCAVTTNGTVVAASTLGQAPPPLRSGALSGLLLSAGEVGSIMGARMSVVEPSDAMYTNEPLADGCLVWAGAERYNYQGSGWISVRDQRLVDRPDDADHIAYQAVVAFPDGLTAHDFYDSQVTGWAKCDDRRVDLHDAGDPNAHYWSLTEATDNDRILTITRAEEESTRGWSCQRALTAENNIVVDVRACMHHVNDQGSQIAWQIAEKVEQQ
ncbi:sensor domain-containing protein [Mycolicibacterium fortuitum]|jgi:hypothetical protein|uniref:Sensor domain-containing protein n=2 Tax=Mycolicibacterium fortuitum TaxID=1766 RepID=A0AAE4VGS8_MYCFO|nr:sensor domain-containing protein [Mycolicibacterium fortuitum]MCV7139542.1 sensor domain-containing protein [Mycolicibacterium fortuitum]MDV7193814.1 sensor domain-containing protein [Mycolicibacterium fortuitum]MDV7207223.1 sensor domain-containing protein [Mycolicibacterium fortuitum]MDV7228828.1 sensor domain-containing protein [Mycolicibacterium fortuitum]MDV7260675.1 sensor domain-containing protein [Mycolicibacterium fortuitum]